MLRKVLITLGVIVVVLVIAYFYLDNRNRTLSPPGEAHLTNSGLTVDITYSRPSVRDRLIFGPESDKALQPYGVYWRLGANEATQITFSEDVTFNGEPLPKGTYRIYAIPGEGAFEIRLNSELGVWGAFEPDYNLDVLSTQVEVQSNSKVEQFTIDLEQAEAGVDLVVTWDNILLNIPIRNQ